MKVEEYPETSTLDYIKWISQPRFQVPSQTIQISCFGIFSILVSVCFCCILSEQLWTTECSR